MCVCKSWWTFVRWEGCAKPYAVLWYECGEGLVRLHGVSVKLQHVCAVVRIYGGRRGARWGWVNVGR
jgi:hypothetical protein